MSLIQFTRRFQFELDPEPEVKDEPKKISRPIIVEQESKSDLRTGDYLKGLTDKFGIAFRKGDTVIVPNPEKEDDTWVLSFTGTVLGVKEGTRLIVIQDQDGDCWDIEPERLGIMTDKPAQTETASESKSGNGHASRFTRKLVENERVTILAEFMKLNGCLSDDKKECTRIRDLCDAVVTVWQVTGYVSVLHRYVATGQMVVKDMDRYIEWMRAKYKGLWAQWNNTLNTWKRKQGSVTEPVEKLLASYQATLKPSTEGVVIRPPKFAVFRKRGYLRSTV